MQESLKQTINGNTSAYDEVLPMKTTFERQRLQMEEWSNSNYNSVDSGYADQSRSRTKQNPSCAILHKKSNTFRSDRPIVQHLTQVMQDKDN
mmetsp:Transcript_10266/g.13909  ORF Transcript_10266/g.13909 Transcript_10266/m.13909 type:complete len:92 (+) Transcript_10266:333-608(+)